MMDLDFAHYFDSLFPVVIWVNITHFWLHAMMNVMYYCCFLSGCQFSFAWYDHSLKREHRIRFNKRTPNALLVFHVIYPSFCVILSQYQLWHTCLPYLQTLTVDDRVLREGDWISLNGSTGEVILGKQPMVQPAMSGDLGEFMKWVETPGKGKNASALL